MAGYSATPLEHKLGIKPDLRTAVIGAPPGFVLTGVKPFRRLAPELAVIVCFVRTEAELRRRLPRLQEALTATGSLWIAWPKRSSGVACDLSESRLRALILPDGLVDNKVCAIDETWSGLRFVVRVANRASWQPAAGAVAAARDAGGDAEARRIQNRSSD